MKKILSLVMTVAMVLCLFPAAVFAADDVVHTCSSAEGIYCLVCDVAEKINALPDAENITVDNAATVTDQIHAIDRIKGELTAGQYYEMMTLVDGGNDGSGYGEDVPVRYMEAVAAVCALDEPSLYVTKMFLSEDGRAVIVDDAEVQFQVTNIATNVSQTLTMSDMKAAPGSLSAAADFYSETADGNGWSYKYILPAGTYRVEEVSYSGTTENDADIVTTKVTYNGVESTDGCIVTLAAGAKDDVNVETGNYLRPNYNIDVKDSEGNSVSGVNMSIQGVTEPDFSHVWETDGEATQFALMDNREYTLTVNSVPDGYEMPSLASVTFTADGDGSEFTDSFALTANGNNYTVDVTIASVKNIEAKFETLADAGYYSETSDSEDKVGVIALNVRVINAADIQGHILKYGMWIYKNGVPVELSIPDNASETVSQLVADNGYYHAIVKNIPQEEFNTVFYGIPFVVVDNDGDFNTSGDLSILTCEAVSATVSQYYNWLGAVNPY